MGPGPPLQVTRAADNHVGHIDLVLPVLQGFSRWASCRKHQFHLSDTSPRSLSARRVWGDPCTLKWPLNFKITHLEQRTRSKELPPWVSIHKQQTLSVLPMENICGKNWSLFIAGQNSATVAQHLVDLMPWWPLCLMSSCSYCRQWGTAAAWLFYTMPSSVANSFLGEERTNEECKLVSFLASSSSLVELHLPDIPQDPPSPYCVGSGHHLFIIQNLRTYSLFSFSLYFF